MNEGSYDVFVSYRHAHKPAVQAFCEQIRARGLRVFLDHDEREDLASIQRTIDQGLVRSKLLLAWYTPDYLDSLACAWEFSRALIAASHDASAGAGGPWTRIVCVDPTGAFRHIEPEALRDQAQPVPAGDDAALIRAISRRAAGIAAPFGDIVAQDGGTRWYGLPRPAHPGWVGRGADLVRVFGNLSRGRLAMHGEQPAPVALTGFGGDGKTMLAQQYALRFAPAYPGGVLWLSGATADGVTPKAGDREQQLESALTAVARDLGMDVEAVVQGHSGARERVEALRRAIGRRLDAPADTASPMRALWIVDDLPDELPADEQRRWLAPAGSAHDLVTIREAGGMSDGFRVQQVSPLSEAEAMRLLMPTDPPRPPQGPAEDAAARQLVAALDRLPLALRLASGLIAADGSATPYANCFALLQAPPEAGFDAMVEELRPALPTGHAPSILRTFLRSLDKLPNGEAENAATIDRATWAVLRAAALLAPAPLPRSMAVFVLAELPESRTSLQEATALFARARLRLQRASLIQPEVGSGADLIRVHALIARTVVHARLDASTRDKLGRTLVMASANEYVEHQHRLGADHPDTLSSMLRLASTNYADGDFPAAWDIQTLALEKVAASGDVARLAAVEREVEALWRADGSDLTSFHAHFDTCRARYGLPPRGSGDTTADFNARA